MKILFLLLSAILCCNTLVAQPPVPEWNNLAQIRLLDSTRAEVQKIFSSDSFLSWRDGMFSGTNAVIQVMYATANCTDDNQDWDVPAGTVTEIIFTPKDRISGKAIGMNYSRFRKERTDRQRKNIYVRFDKKAGIAISFFGDKVEAIHLFPPQSNYNRLCNKPDIREYFSSDRWVRGPVPDNLTIDYNLPAYVIDLTVTDRRNGFFDIATKAIDPENDILTYSYIIDAGKIVGAGANVVWDLSGVKPGTYKITAAVDDGMGWFGKYFKKTVTVP